MTRRSYRAADARGMERCSRDIVLGDGSGAQCMRAAVSNGLCAQHGTAALNPVHAATHIDALTLQVDDLQEQIATLRADLERARSALALMIVRAETVPHFNDEGDTDAARAALESSK